MEGTTILSCSTSSAALYSRTHSLESGHGLALSRSSSPLHAKSRPLYSSVVLGAPKERPLAVLCSRTSLRTSVLAVEEAVERSRGSVAPAREMLPKIDKSGRFCSPRAARELALYAPSLSVFCFSFWVKFLWFLFYHILCFGWN